MVINRFDLEDIKPKIEDEFDIYQIEEETLKKFETSKYSIHIVILSDFVYPWSSDILLSLATMILSVFSAFRASRMFMRVTVEPC